MADSSKGSPNNGLPGGTRTSFLLLAAMALAAMALSHVPVVRYLLYPLEYFATALHELGHASACLATGGSVSGLTIVGDGAGHAGLTFCRGGFQFVVAQAGYMGTTIFGCLLLWLTSFKGSARAVLTGLALVMALTVVLFMSATLAMPGYFVQGILSMAVGLVGAAAMFYTAYRAPESFVRILVLFLAVHTSLNALSDIALVTMLSVGMVSGGTSDATSLAAATGVPAVIWSAVWAVLSVGLLFLTVRNIYSKRAPAA